MAGVLASEPRQSRRGAWSWRYGTTAISEIRAKASLPLVIATMLILTWSCSSSGQGHLAPGAEVTIEMPDGSLVTGRVARPAVDGQPAGDGESVATVEQVAEGAVSREPAAVAPQPPGAVPRLTEDWFC